MCYTSYKPHKATHPLNLNDFLSECLLQVQVALVEQIVSKQLPRPQSATAGRGSNLLLRFATFLRLKVPSSLHLPQALQS